MTQKPNARKLWNRDFTLLWQGQLVSDLGQAAFTVILGFWVLDITNSTAIMGIILACFTLPRVLFGPFAGAFADRSNKRLLIVFSDLLRGILFVGMGALILTKKFPFWLIYPFALLISFFGAFFTPAINASVPEIVHKDNLSRANSARGISQTASSLVGNAFGGVLYAIVSGPVFFVINGICFIYSAISEVFIRIPHVKRETTIRNILHDMTDGFKYAWSIQGIKILLGTGMFINFFVTMGVTLLQPLFKYTEGFGVERYGYTMASLMLGAILGMLILSFYRIKPAKRFSFYKLATYGLIVCMLIAGFTKSFGVIMVLGFFAGICNSFISVITQTVMQITVSKENRGKVFGIQATIYEGLSPLAMALSGIVAHFAGVRPTIIGSFMLAALVVLPTLFNKTFGRFMNSDGSANQPEQVMAGSAPVNDG
ncbi:MAG TPA: MFS transporter [Thermoclostridium caenicola]|nr:MFS transporter [Thermoclostridium caenicola]